jgi:diguanylate cyclase (GGDEF)-like protein
MSESERDARLAALQARVRELERELSARRIDEAALRDASRLYPAILDALPTGVAVIDRGGAIVAVNSAWSERARAGGSPAETEPGFNFLEACRREEGAGAEDAQRAAEGIAAVLERKTPAFSMEWLRSAHGEARWFHLIAAPLGAGDFAGAVLLQTDITHRKADEARISHIANHDPLTGLPNRRLLDDRLQQAMASAARRQEVVAALYIDLDEFKVVNDRFGHAEGDRILKDLARRMRSAVRDTDTLARVGGDEFTLIAQLHQPGGAVLIAKKILQALQEPVACEGGSIQMGGSVGIALWPDDADSAELLERRADQAMYRAKQAGRNRLCRYGGDPEDFSA